MNLIKYFSLALMIGAMSSCSTFSKTNSEGTKDMVKTENTITLQESYQINASVEQCRNAWLDSSEITKWLALTGEVSSADKSDYCITSLFPYISGRHQLTRLTR